MLSEAQIEEAVAESSKSGKAHHEHNDCVRIAFQWLDAQKKLKNQNRSAGYALKHLIEKWAGRYVSQSDVEVAARLHPNIFGTYPCYNISSRLVEPSRDRLDNIGEAFTHLSYQNLHRSDVYKTSE